jgi:glycosyltransferase involved in cell wall biosynthesis
VGTFCHEVDAYIALTAFQRDIVIRDGLPAEKIYIKPNFTPTAVSTNIESERKAQMAFVGEICTEKGVDLVLSAWTKSRPSGYRLLLFGHGPALEEMQQQYAGDNSVVWRGFQPREVVVQELAASKYIVVGSRWYETFGMVLIEAFSVGTPAIVPDHAAFPEMMEQGRCGFLYEPSNVQSLVHAFCLALSVGESKWREQSDAALRRSCDYGSNENYIRLMEIYEAARTHYSGTQEYRHHLSTRNGE